MRLFLRDLVKNGCPGVFNSCLHSTLGRPSAIITKQTNEQASQSICCFVGLLVECLAIKQASKQTSKRQPKRHACQISWDCFWSMPCVSSFNTASLRFHEKPTACLIVEDFSRSRLADDGVRRMICARDLLSCGCCCPWCWTNSWLLRLPSGLRPLSTTLVAIPATA